MPAWTATSSGSPRSGPPYQSLVPPPRMRSATPRPSASRTRSSTSASGLPTARLLEPLEVRMRQRAAVHVLPAVLRAAMQGGDALARVEQARRVE
ncbi:MAG: hypothetical protein ACK56I_00130, partial [bacterium]